MIPVIYNLDQIDAIKEVFQEQGYAVVQIPSIDLQHLHDLFSEDMSQILGEDVDMEQLWSKSCSIPESGHPGLMGEYGLSQGNAAWYVRTNKDIIALYKQLLQCQSVVCSSDAVGFSQNDAYLHAEHVRWLHVDQNPNAKVGSNLLSIQGIFYVEDSTPERSGTVVVPRSHKQWLSHNYISPSHFHVVDQDRFSKDAVKLDIPAGCLLLFNSKLVHQGRYGPRRLCFMVSYGNKQDRSEQVRQRKIVMYLGGHRSNHWSQYGIYHGWKWRHGEPWNMLVPKLRDDATLDDHLDMVEDEVTDAECYEPLMDQCVPVDRLELL